MTIRTGSRARGDQRYGCARHWRRGDAVYSSNVHVRRDLAEQAVVGLLREKLYTASAVARLTEKVNARLRECRPERVAARAQLLERRDEIDRTLHRLRRFIEDGDVSAKVREWLAEAERHEQQIASALAGLDALERQAPLQVHPVKVEGYLRDLEATLVKAGWRARELLHRDVERIVIHPVRTETAKPFARAEIVTTGKGLLTV